MGNKKGQVNELQGFLNTGNFLCSLLSILQQAHEKAELKYASGDISLKEGERVKYISVSTVQV